MARTYIPLKTKKSGGARKGAGKKSMNLKFLDMKTKDQMKVIVENKIKKRLGITGPASEWMGIMRHLIGRQQSVKHSDEPEQWRDRMKLLNLVNSPRI